MLYLISMGMDAGPARECLQSLAGALQEASDAVSRAQQLQQGAAEEVAAELKGSLDRVHANASHPASEPTQQLCWEVKHMLLCLWP